MLIWTELPNGGMATDRSRGRKEKLLKGIVDRDGNHPSIIIWTIINENWGVDLVNDADHRDWLKRTFALAQGLRSDPPRGRQLAAGAELPRRVRHRGLPLLCRVPGPSARLGHFVDELSNRAPGSIRRTATR